MRTTRRVRTLAFALLAAVMAAGCAAGGGEEGASSPAPADGFAINVQNNIPGNGPIVVMLIPATGVQTQLGEVAENSTVTFTHTGQPGTYRLIARGSGGERNSGNFQIYRGSQATWNMQSNRVMVSNR
jgi:hypothetical protein